MNLPEITEVKRLTVHPGDRVIVRCVRDPNMHEAHEIKQKVEAVLGVPVLVHGPSVDIEVIGPEEAT